MDSRTTGSGSDMLGFAAGDLKASKVLCIAYDAALTAAGLPASFSPTASRVRQVAESAEKTDGVAFHMAEVVLVGLAVPPTYSAVMARLSERALDMEDVREAVKRLRTPEGRAASMAERMQSRIRQCAGNTGTRTVAPQSRRSSRAGL